MIIAAAMSLIVQAAPASQTPARQTVEYARYDVGDLLRTSGDAAARDADLAATREFGERAWRWLGVPAVKQQVAEAAILDASAPGVLALAASAQRHEQLAAFLAWQREESCEQMFSLAVYTCELAAAEALELKQPGDRALLTVPAEAGAEGVVEQVRRACGDKVDVLLCPKVVTRGVARASISTATEHEFVVDAIEQDGGAIERHRTVAEGVAIEASAVKLGQGYWGVDLALETMELVQPVRTAPTKLKRADGSAIVLSLPETDSARSRVSLKMKPGATLLWRTGLEGSASKGTCTLVSLHFDSKPAANDKR